MKYSRQTIIKYFALIGIAAAMFISGSAVSYAADIDVLSARTSPAVVDELVSQLGLSAVEDLLSTGGVNNVIEVINPSGNANDMLGNAGELASAVKITSVDKMGTTLLTAGGDQVRSLFDGSNFGVVTDFVAGATPDVLDNFGSIISSSGGIDGFQQVLGDTGPQALSQVLNQIGGVNSTILFGAAGNDIVQNVGDLINASGGVDGFISAMTSGNAFDMGSLLGGLGAGNSTDLLGSISGNADILSGLGDIVGSGGSISSAVQGILGSGAGDFGTLVSGLGLPDSVDFLGGLGGGGFSNLGGILDVLPGDINSITGDILNTGAGDFGQFLGNAGGSLGGFFDGGGSLTTIQGAIAGGVNPAQLGQVFNGAGGAAINNFVANNPAGALTQQFSGGAGTAGIIGAIGGGSLPGLGGGIPGLGDGGGIPGLGGGVGGEGGTEIFTQCGAQGVSNGELGEFEAGQADGQVVPVFDSGVNDSIGSLADVTIAGNTLINEAALNTSAAMGLLDLICVKELFEDSIAQHAWRAAIGDYVQQFMQLVSNGYNGNPLFITNPYIYYEEIDRLITETMIIELNQVADTEVAPEVKRAIMQQLKTKGAGDYIDPAQVQNALGPDIVDQLGNDFQAAGDWDTILRLGSDNIANPSEFANLWSTELQVRIEQAHDIEREKLAWGRGFLGIETCDLKRYSAGIGSRLDRRNCRITTPAAVIQEHTSLVLGSALRQMELNDEHDEWISELAFSAMQKAFSSAGMRAFGGRANQQVGTLDGQSFRLHPTPGSAGGGGNTVLFQVDRTGLGGGDFQPPWIFVETVIDDANRINPANQVPNL